MPNRTARAFGEHVDRQVFMQMSRNPRNDVGKSIGRLCLKSKRLGILLLLARTFDIHDELARDRERKLRPVIFLDQRKGKIDSRRDSGRGVERSVFNIDGVWN